jgi:uncharacterized membrane protein SpoIIM required for sporulation
MKPSTFQQRGERRWRELEQVLDRLDSSGKEVADASRLPGLFRQICGDLSLAQYRMYGLALCERINQLVIRGYRHLHRDRSNLLIALWAGIARDFPILIRQEWRLFWMINLFFWLPFWAVYASSYYDMRWTASLLGPDQIAKLELGFGKGEGFASVRDNFGSNFQMFAFYIANNIGIDFRTFAGGILGGIGTLFFVVINALMIGASAGYIQQEGDMGKFLDWVSGHSAPEFLGMVFSAMAGMRLGLALIRPGRQTRGQALATAGRRAVNLLYGAALVTFLAAVIEGFWSPLQLPIRMKYTFGLTLMGLLVVWLLLAGRGREERRAA